MDSVQDIKQTLGRVSWASLMWVLTAAGILRESAEMKKAVMGHLLGLYFVCQIILGLLLFRQWGLFTEPFGLLYEKEKGKSSFAFFFFSPKLKLSGDVQFSFLETCYLRKKSELKELT